jgi:putative SOS response-associated peptidase YedK
MRCRECCIRFAVLEEKILWRGELYHRRCLTRKIAAQKGDKIKKNKFFIYDKDLVPVSISGVYNTYLYTPGK